MQSSQGYGQVAGSPVQKKRRYAVVIVSSLILVAMLVAVAVSVSRPHDSSDGSKDRPSASVKAIESICQPTDYKEECVKSLTAAADGNTTDPKGLVGISFKVAMDHIYNVFNNSKTLQEAHKDPRTAHALQNCQELLDYSVDDLQRCFDKLGKFDFSMLHKFIEDMKVWISASLTYQETCLDGFEGASGDVAKSMRKAMNSSMALTSNALAIVDGISSMFAELKIPSFNRRLMSEEDGEGEVGLMPEDGLPTWVTGTKRRLLTAPIDDLKPDAVVAKDGSGKFKTVVDAVVAAPKKSEKPFVIYIKEGVYKENIKVNKSKINIVMIGDGPTKTVLTGSLNFIDGVSTFRTATLAAVGNGFMAKDLGIENSAGPEKHQAVALKVQSDESVFYNCHINGYQDTLYVHTHRQFYRDCLISGTIDFIFGNSATIFQNCVMLVRKPMANQQNIVTAQGRKDRREPTAIVLQNCTIKADPRLEPFKVKNPTFLGRPWKEYSRTIIMHSQIDDVINPKGWLPWVGDFALDTCYYAEFDNRGSGSGTSDRVTWRGIVKNVRYELAQQYTVENFFEGSKWINPTGVPYIPGLLPVSHYTSPATTEPVKGVIGPPQTTAPAEATTSPSPAPTKGA